MKDLSVSQYADQKELVIKYINSVVIQKSRQEYFRTRKTSFYRRFFKSSIASKTVRWVRGKLNSNKKSKILSSIKTRSPIKIKNDFLKAISGFESEVQEMERHINTVIVKADNDESILEECENYLNRAYKIHSIQLQSTINWWFFLVFALTFTLVAFLLTDSSPTVDVQKSEVNTKITRFLTLLILPLTASTTIANTIMIFSRPSIEVKHLYSTSAYEYCLEIIKNARLRLKSSIKTSKHKSNLARHRLILGKYRK
jgi:hypothetical protein